jgi:hypothetical protein
MTSRYPPHSAGSPGWPCATPEPQPECRVGAGAAVPGPAGCCASRSALVPGNADRATRLEPPGLPRPTLPSPRNTPPNPSPPRYSASASYPSPCPFPRLAVESRFHRQQRGADKGGERGRRLRLSRGKGERWGSGVGWLPYHRFFANVAHPRP